MYVMRNISTEKGNFETKAYKIDQKVLWKLVYAVGTGFVEWYEKHVC